MARNSKTKLDWLSLASDRASRSDFMHHRTGCVIVKGDSVVGDGWSHVPSVRYSQYRSVHAELHALIRAHKPNLLDSIAHIITLTKANRWTNAKPCLRCLELLIDAGVSSVIFSIGDNLTCTLDLQKPISKSEYINYPTFYSDLRTLKYVKHSNRQRNRSKNIPIGC